MAKHYHKKHHHHRRRHNPFGISSGLVTDAAWNTGGALGSLWLGGTISTAMPTLASGWGGVLGTGLAALGVSFLGKTIGGARASEEVMKGGLVAVMIKALHQAGIAQNMGLGLYTPSWFGIPTSSDQYLRSAAPGMAWNRGAGSIWFPGPGGQPALALPAHAAASLKGMGFHRFRSRYAGNY
jgi:hypothetical protein